GSKASGARDTDGDTFKETIELSQQDASLFVRGESASLCDAMRGAIRDWLLMPSGSPQVASKGAPLAAAEEGVPKIHMAQEWPRHESSGPALRVEETSAVDAKLTTPVLEVPPGAGEVAVDE